MKQFFTIIFILFVCINFSLAQQKSIFQASPERDLNAPITLKKELSLPELKSSLEGSYRIEFSQANYQIVYSRDLLETIKNSRKEFEDVTLQWDQFTTIIIYARQNLENNTTTE